MFNGGFFLSFSSFRYINIPPSAQRFMFLQTHCLYSDAHVSIRPSSHSRYSSLSYFHQSFPRRTLARTHTHTHTRALTQTGTVHWAWLGAQQTNIIVQFAHYTAHKYNPCKHCKVK